MNPPTPSQAQVKPVPALKKSLKLTMIKLVVIAVLFVIALWLR